MLLYVNKKEERRKKIKKLITTISIILFCIINLLYLYKHLNYTNSNILTYTSPIKAPEWYTQTSPVVIFYTKDKTHFAILIPEELNRENLKTISVALSKLPTSINNLYFADKIENNKILLELIQVYTPQIQQTQDKDKAELIIASKEDNLLPLLNNQNFYPKTINYKQIKHYSLPSQIYSIIDTNYPIAFTPKTQLETEQQNLQNFAKDNKDKLLSYFSQRTISNVDFPLSTDNLFLKNVRLCISGALEKSCSLKKHQSLEKNIENALKKFTTHNKPQRLSLLTSFKKIADTETIEKDEGIFFRFEKREYLMLPNEIAKYKKQNSTNLFNYIKLQSGINPEYKTPKMQFYKFKTVEINLNDNI